MTHDASGIFALRTTLFFDGNATVRSRAAERLGALGDPLALPWLLEATDDPSGQVRFEAWRSVARCGRRGDPKALAKAVSRTRDEPVWWVRRAAVLAVGVLGEGSEVVPSLAGALDDPFWRVRQAALRVLLALTEADGGLMEAVLAAVPADPVAQAAAGFLRTRWQPGWAPEGLVLEPNSVRVDDGFWNADPAVMTARLESRSDVSPMALIEHLADPHEPLRRLCVRRLTAAADTEVLRAACHWLEHPRIPHGAETARALLDRVGGRAEPVAAWCLSRPELKGGRAWAVAWVDRTQSVALREAAAQARGPDAPEDPLAVARASGDVETLKRAVEQGDFAERPKALEALSALGALPDATRAECLGDPDPWVRAAVMSLPSACEMAVADPDREVRRAALRWVLRERAGLSSERRSTIAAAVAGDEDPRVRALGCRLFSRERDLAGLLAASLDPAPEVRFAAARRLERMADLEVRVGGLLARAQDLDPKALKGAYTWRFRAFDGPAREGLQRAFDDPRTPDEVRDFLAAMSLGFEAGAPCAVAARRAVVTSSTTARSGEVGEAVGRRRLGPLEARPLAISGVYELGARSYARALERGVDLFFWEPRYRELTRFLRGGGAQSGARVIAGTYEGSAASITRDVERALRRLRCETIDVFLLFWTRSPERLSDEAFECLTRLKREGKIRAAGFSTHHRQLACEAIVARPWDVVMTRHSAAHPGGEDALFPTARSRGVGVLTFSALSYGRLLKVPPGSDSRGYPALPTAADCYRYSVSQAGVGACIAAPRTVAELQHDLGVLGRDRLDPEAMAALRAHGARVREASRRFNAFVRQAQGPGLYPTERPAQQAALELFEVAAGETDAA